MENCTISDLALTWIDSYCHGDNSEQLFNLVTFLANVGDRKDIFGDNSFRKLIDLIYEFNDSGTIHNANQILHYAYELDKIAEEHTDKR